MCRLDSNGSEQGAVKVLENMFRAVFWVVLPCRMIVDNNSTRQYNPEDSSEHHTRRRENLKSHFLKTCFNKTLDFIKGGKFLIN
jgi:hypothetical protein